MTRSILTICTLLAAWGYVATAHAADEHKHDDKPVDIDLEDQEPPDRVWCSRQHAVVHWDDSQGVMTIEDLNSANGTFVNRARIHPGQKRQLYLNDVVQIGTIQLKVTF